MTPSTCTITSARARSVSPTGRSSGRPCGLRGYPGDEAAKLSDLVAAGGVLRQKLAVAAERCSDELVEFFQGAD